MMGSSLHSEPLRLSGRTSKAREALKEITPAQAITKKAVHPSTGDHISVGASKVSTSSKSKSELIRCSGPLPQNPKHKDISEGMRAPHSERGSNLNYRMLSKESSCSVRPHLQVSEGSFSELVISDCEGDAIKETPRRGIGGRGVGMGIDSPLSYRELSEQGKMFHRSTEPGEILPSGTERSSNYQSPSRMAAR